jgi:hypothetical protein
MVIHDLDDLGYPNDLGHLRIRGWEMSNFFHTTKLKRWYFMSNTYFFGHDIVHINCYCAYYRPLQKQAKASPRGSELVNSPR